MLRDQLRSNTCKKMVRLRTKGKGKRVQRHDSEFDREIQWVKEMLNEEEAKRAAEVVQDLKMQEEGGIECGCCFCEYPFVRGLGPTLALSRSLDDMTMTSRTRWCNVQKRTSSVPRA